MPDWPNTWKTQPEEERPVEFESLMNRRAGELYAATRAEVIASIAAAVFFVAVVAWRLADVARRWEQIGFAALILWAAVTLVWLRRSVWPRAGAKDAFAAPSRDFYRQQLERRRDHLRNAWLWHGPLVLACVLFAAVAITNVTYRSAAQVLPLAILLALWTVFGIVRRYRQAAAIQREIDELERRS